MKRIQIPLVLAALWFAEFSSTVVADSRAAFDLSVIAEDTSPKIAGLKNAVAKCDSAALVSFWTSTSAAGTPLIEVIPGDPKHVLVTFLWRAVEPTTKVILFAQLSNSRDPSALTLARLLDTDLWYKTFRMRHDLRFSYSFFPNTNTASIRDTDAKKIDPLNHHQYSTAPDRGNPNATVLGGSIVELPD